jgi:hypothetical protein
MLDNCPNESVMQTFRNECDITTLLQVEPVSITKSYASDPKNAVLIRQNDLDRWRRGDRPYFIHIKNPAILAQAGFLNNKSKLNRQLQRKTCCIH